jgi:hypothetical protein
MTFPLLARLALKTALGLWQFFIKYRASWDGRFCAILDSNQADGLPKN